MLSINTTASDISSAPLEDGRPAGVENSQETFDSGALNVLSGLRNSIERLVLSISKGLQNSRDLQNLLAVDRNLSWQVFKMMGPIETLSTLPYVPASASMTKLLAATKKKGAPVNLVADAQAAFSRFETFVASTAGDRERFETMALSSSNTAESQQIDIQHRKAAFKANSHFFGIEVDTVVNTVFYHPSGEGVTYDVIALLDLVAMRRLRLDTDVKVHGARCSDGTDVVIRPYGTLDDKAADFYNAPLVPEFCTQPIPPLETITLPTGMQHTLLKSREIGVGKEIDLAMGRVYKNVTLSKHPVDGDYFGTLLEMTRPTKLLIFDMLVPRSPDSILHPYVATYAHAPREKPMPDVEREGIRMPVRETFAKIGSGIEACRIREVPRYLDLLRHTCGKMNWDDDGFDVYRLRVEYPLMDSIMVMRLSQ